MIPNTLPRRQPRIPWIPTFVVLTIGLQTSACGGGPAPTAEPQARPTSGKPPLSEMVRSVLAESEDLAVANVELMDFYSGGLENYELDEPAILALGREYLAAGDDAAAEVVISFLQMAAYQVTGTVSAGVWAAHGDIALARGDDASAAGMYQLALGEDPDHDDSRRRLAALGTATASAPERASSPGSASAPGPEIERRHDLARFRFMYAKAGDPAKTLGVSETCYDSGILRVVPGWLDEGPWVFHSVSDTVFEQVNAPAGELPVRLEFELSPSDSADAVVVTGPVQGRFEWSSYLPDGFEPEMGACD